MTNSKKKEPTKKPLDMTTEEAINYLFPKPLVKGLSKEARAIETATPKPRKLREKADEYGDDYLAYKNHN